jgi:hypothetical protein
MSGESPVSVLEDSNSNALAVQNAAAIPASTPALMTAGSDGTNSRYITIDTLGRQVVVGAGTAGVSTGGVISIQGIGSGTPVPVSGTVTAANASVSGTGSAPPDSATYVGGSVTTAAPVYTTGQMSGLSLTTAGALRIDGSGVTQPVSGTITANAGSGTFAVSGTVTSNIGTTNGLALDATLAKTTIALSAALGSNTQTLVGGSVTTSAPTYITGNINPLSLTTTGALRVDGSGVTQPVSGTITANQGGAPWSQNVTQFGGTNISTGTGVGGVGIPRVTVSNDSNVLITPPTLTKGTQGATGLSTQDLKDAGRVIKTYVAAAVAGVTTEALVTLTPYADLVAGGTATTFAVTAGKRLRLQSMIVTWRNNTAVAGGVTINFRTNAGTVLVSSPIQFAVNASTALATIGSGTTQVLMFPDGLELSGTMQFGLTQLAVGAVVGFTVSCVGYEY